MFTFLRSLATLRTFKEPKIATGKPNRHSVKERETNGAHITLYYVTQVSKREGQKVKFYL